MSRRGVAPLVLGAVVGILVTGLLLPFTIDGEGQPGGVGVAAGTDAGSTSGAIDDAVIDGADPSTPDGVTAPPGGGGGPGRAADSSGPAQGTVPSPGGGPGATDVGVTETTIKVGFLLLDIGQLSRFGVSAPIVDPALLREAYQAFVDDLNEAGGIHGRTIEAVYRTYELTSPDSARAACLALTEDEKVFLVVGEYTARAATLCITREHGRPFLTPGLTGLDNDAFAQSRGLLFSLYPGGNAQVTNLARDLHNQGQLKDKKVGIVNQLSNDPTGGVGDTLEAVLDGLGHDVVYRADFSEDNAEAASQVPVHVQQMRASGADFVVLLANTVVSTQFTQSADGQGYRPAYVMTDWNSMNTDTGAQNLPPSLDGTIGITHGKAYEFRAGIPEGAASRACIELYNRQTGKTTARDQLSYQSVIWPCAHHGQMVNGLRVAGRDLTAASFSRGLQSVTSPISEASAWWNGAYGAGKFGYADEVRTQLWRSSCRCWVPSGPFRRP